MVIGIFVFAFVGRPVWYWLIVSRILLLPVIAGLAYELIRYAGKHQDNRVLMTLLAPGLWLQRLTTREPTLDQIEVSIRAMDEVRRREADETAQPSGADEARKVEVDGRDRRRRSAMPRIVREAERELGGNAGARRGRADRGVVRRVRRAAGTRSRRGSATRRARRAPRSCSPPRTAAASRCRSPAS